MSTEPWQTAGEPGGGFYDTPDAFLSPGSLAGWQREEAAIRAEERRKEEERIERAEIRQQAAMWEARQYCLARGLPWDPQRPFANVPDIYQRADMAFAAQDREARAADLRSAQEAGLVHLLHQGVPSTPKEPEGSAAATSGSAARNRVPLIGVAPDVTTPAGRITAALRRWPADRRHRQRMDQP
jgi:hypothetical protein